MKRYSVSELYSKNRFHYVARTDNPDKDVERFKKIVDGWRDRVKEESEWADEFIGMRITDSKTKEVVFEETHYSEELGYKKVYELVDVGYGCQVRKGHWVRL